MKLNGRNFRIPRRMMIRLVVVTIAGIVAWFGKQNKGGNQAPSGKATPSETQGEFQVFSNSTLVSNKYNDGDSFMVSHNGSQQEYRLYFVDTPESKDKPYQDHKERVRKQGNALGGISYEETIKVGQQAKNFTKHMLKKPFRVYTTNEIVYDGPRKYAFIQVKHEGKDQWLHEILVEEGLGRIHTKGVETPEGVNWKNQKNELKRLESQAKKEKRGAWKY